MTRSRARRALPILLSILLALGAGASTAEAGPLVQSAKNCTSGTTQKAFLRWLDPLNYTLVPAGSFESGATGWKLSKASVVSGNEPFYVHGARESRSLSISSGGSATTPTLCVGIDKPVLRFFARSSGGGLLNLLRAEVLFESSTGAVLSLPVGVVTPGGWAPTLPMPVLASLLPLLPGGQTPVQFRFTPLGSASWQIDDVYVDPRKQ